MNRAFGRPWESPALQQVPVRDSELRKLANRIAEENRVIFNIDYAALELRLWAAHGERSK